MKLFKIKTFALAAVAFAGFTISAPAMAEDAPAEAAEKVPDFKLSGSVALTSDYRLRGVSQSDLKPAVQGGVTLAHKSGMYVGFWGSNLAGWGTFGGPNLELDLIFGWKFGAGPLTIDAGVTTYTYPGGAPTTTYAELFAKVSGTLGPVSVLGGLAYAPSQQALGNWYNTGEAYQLGLPDDPGASNDNIYVWTDMSGGIPGIPLTLKGHVGYSSGNPGLGPNGTSVAPTGSYWDWLIGADFAVGPVTLGIAWVDTSINDQSLEYLKLQPNFSALNGKSISGSTALFTLTAAF